MLARSLARERELAVRAALGAGHGRLLRQLLTESTLVGVAGGALGLLLAAAGLDLLVTFAGRFSERAAEVRIDGAVLAFTLVVSLAAGLAAGALPALRRREPAAALGEGGARTTGGVSGMRSRETLIVLQLAVSLLLLVGAGLAGRSLAALYRVDPGFDPANVLVTRLHLNWTKYAEDEQIAGFAGPLLERAERLPGVAAAAIAGTFPLSEDGPVEVPVAIEGLTADSTADLTRAPRAEIQRVTAGYFRAAGVPLLTGREISDRDREDAPRVAVVSRRLARRRWGDADPIGTRLTPDGGESWWTVVGVAGDVKQHGLAEEFADIVYLPFAQAPTRGVSLLLRTRGGRPGDLAPAVRDTVRELDAGQPISEQRTLAEVRTEQLASPGLTALLVGLFACLALAISATGIAGVIAFAVSRRRHEIGIRLALGAARGTVLRMVLGRGLMLVGAGLALGLAAALATGRFVTGMLYGVEPTDPVTYLAVSLTLAAVATAACLLPARRATAIDPLTALREP
jgi:predicted permease